MSNFTLMLYKYKTITFHKHLFLTILYFFYAALIILIKNLIHATIMFTHKRKKDKFYVYL